MCSSVVVVVVQIRRGTFVVQIDRGVFASASEAQSRATFTMMHTSIHELLKCTINTVLKSYLY